MPAYGLYGSNSNCSWACLKWQKTYVLHVHKGRHITTLTSGGWYHITVTRFSALAVNGIVTQIVTWPPITSSFATFIVKVHGSESGPKHDCCEIKCGKQILEVINGMLAELGTHDDDDDDDIDQTNNAYENPAHRVMLLDLVTNSKLTLAMQTLAWQWD